MPAKQFKKIPWCPRPESNRYAPFLEAADFKSDVSTNFTTRAGCVKALLSQTNSLHKVVDRKIQ